MQTTVRVTSVLAGIGTKHFPNTSLELYRYSTQYVSVNEKFVINGGFRRKSLSYLSRMRGWRD
jgi:hypothetical protein